MKNDEYFEKKCDIESRKERKGCLKCKSFWILIGLGVIGSVLLGFAVFDQSFYLDNIFIFADLIRFTLLGGGIVLTTIASHHTIKGYCTGKDDIDYLIGGVVLAIVTVFLIMVAVYFVPMVYDEYVIRSLSDEKIIVNFIANDMNCQTILWHESSYHQVYFDITFEKRAGFGSDAIEQRIKECS